MQCGKYSGRCWEAFPALTVVADEVVRDPDRLVQVLADEKITRIVVVPSLLQGILESSLPLAQWLSRLKLWISDGEVLPTAMAGLFRDRLPESTLLNLYGSSEVSADITWHDTGQSAGGPCVPIGRPVAEYAGLCAGLALTVGSDRRGGLERQAGCRSSSVFLFRPDLTADRFVPHPFAASPGERLYRTGNR